MKRSTTWVSGCTLALLVALVAAVPAAAGPQEPQAQEQEHAMQHEGMEQMPAEMQEKMAAWQKAGAVGEQHKQLAQGAGNWEFTAKFWMAPGGEPMTTTGTSERQMIMDGRVMQEEVTSQMMGEPFKGMALIGYDNVRQHYWSTWTDNMSTSLMQMTGHCAESACNFFGSYVDPADGKVKHSRSTIRFEGKGKEVHQAYEYTPDGTEWKSMEFVYTKKQ